MTSLKLEFLYTNKPLEFTNESVNICCGFLFGNENKINNFDRDNFEKPLGTALLNSFSVLVD